MESNSHANTTIKNLIVGKHFFGWPKEESISCQSLKLHSLPVGALLTSETPDVFTTPSVGEEKIGVLLLNLGGPETLDDVQPFLYNLFADPVFNSLFFCMFCYSWLFVVSLLLLEFIPHTVETRTSMMHVLLMMSLAETSSYI